MSTRHSHNILAFREMTQHLRTLLHLEASLTKILHLGMILGHSRGIYHQRRVHKTVGRGDMLHSILIADLGTLCFECLRQWGLGAVVARHHLLLVEEITGKGTHSYATNTHKIYVIKVFHTTTPFQSDAPHARQRPPRPTSLYSLRAAADAPCRRATPAHAPYPLSQPPHHAPSRQHPSPPMP